jgi:hypothetical protein
METKRYSQFGFFSVILLSLLLIISVVMALTVEKEDRFALMMLGIPVGILLILLLLFYKLVIEIDGTTISFKMGIGLFSHTYRIDSLIRCRSVKNPFISGFGIRKIRNGWLYNVTGSKAVELTFRHSGKVIRIGTDRPDEIAEIITGLMNTDPDDEYLSDQNLRMQNGIVAMVVTLLAVSLFMVYEYQPVKIDLQRNRMEINGTYGLPINYQSIVSIDTISQMPQIGMKSNGIEIGYICKGHFKLTGIGDALLFINRGVSPFVEMKLKNSQMIYFNLENREKTTELFWRIKTKTK